MNQIKKCKLIKFSSLGDQSIGFISVAESMKQIPFNIKRVYWTYHTPDSIVRGQHAHIMLEQVILAVVGKIELKCEYLNGSIEEFILGHPSQGLYIPKMVWRYISFSKGAVLLCIASELYDAKDYIRDYKVFKKLEY